MLNIAFFGGRGEGTLAPLQAVSQHHRVVAVVRARRESWLRRSLKSAATKLNMRAPDALEVWAQIHHVSLMDAVSGKDSDVAQTLGKLAPDIICASAFPWILSGEILQTAKRAALNVHPSLLPRHRGPVPLFWIYYGNDRQTGVTVHLMNRSADAGKILAQSAFELQRGFPVDRLHAQNAHRGAELLLQVLKTLEAGSIEPVAQDEASATQAPHVKEGVPMVDFHTWDCEHVWHFLAGLCPRYREPLVDERGHPVRYQSVLGYRFGSEGHPIGVAQRSSSGWELNCRDGIVTLGDGSIAD